jgi:hypothetical protein
MGAAVVLGRAVLNAFLHKRSHQVPENKGFSILTCSNRATAGGASEKWHRLQPLSSGIYEAAAKLQKQTHFMLRFAELLGKQVALHHRLRSATGSHPLGTLVAR